MKGRQFDNKAVRRRCKAGIARYEASSIYVLTIAILVSYISQGQAFGWIRGTLEGAQRLTLNAGCIAVASPPEERRRAVLRPITRIEASVPIKVGLNYGGRWDSHILDAREDGRLFEQIYAPYALGNVMPPSVLDVSSSAADLILRRGSEVVGIRFFPKTDLINPGYILPFDPFDSAQRADTFIPGTIVDGVLMDCPIQGVPNTAEVRSIIAYSHLRHYMFVTGRYYAYAKPTVAISEAPDVDSFFPVLLFDHYQDSNGAWYVLASQCLRDGQGNIIVSNPSERRCPVYR